MAVAASRLSQASVADRQFLVGKGLPLCWPVFDFMRCFLSALAANFPSDLRAVGEDFFADDKRAESDGFRCAKKGANPAFSLFYRERKPLFSR